MTWLRPSLLLRLGLLWISTHSPALAEDTQPRVLLLGDSIYHQLSPDLKKELGDRVELVIPKMEPGDVRHSRHLLEHLDELLGDGNWDLIVFNCGLGDLMYRAPNMQSFRVLPRHAGGVRTTDPSRYETNLGTLAKRLQSSSKAKLVWASTTPIRASTSDVFELGSEIEYNAIASRVMAAHSIPVHDMYHAVREQIDMNKPASHGADPFFFDRKPIHLSLARCIETQLGLEAPQAEPAPKP